MKGLLAASLVGLAAVAGASEPDRIPAHFSVCVTTVDADGRARVDSNWYVEADARDRRAEITRDGWIAQGDEADREDAYPPRSIVKVTIDPTLLNGASCRPPTVDKATASEQDDIGSSRSVPEGVAIPAQFAVCVTTADGRYARVDSFWASSVDARVRRAEILRDGWSTAGDEPDREDLYPPHAIVKATIDDVLVNQPSCLPPDRP